MINEDQGRKTTRTTMPNESGSPRQTELDHDGSSWPDTLLSDHQPKEPRDGRLTAIQQEIAILQEKQNECLTQIGLLREQMTEILARQEDQRDNHVKLPSFDELRKEQACMSPLLSAPAAAPTYGAGVQHRLDDRRLPQSPTESPLARYHVRCRAYPPGRMHLYALSPQLNNETVSPPDMWELVEPRAEMFGDLESCDDRPDEL